MAKTIGIDLGTSYTTSAIFEDGAPQLLLNQEGGRTTPNVVALGPDDEWLVGQAARRAALSRSQNAFRDFLRLLGRPSDSPEVRNASTYAPFRLVEGPEGHVHIRTDRGDYHPAALVALVLAKQKAVAEAKLETSVDQAVIALPPSYHSDQKRLVREAARIAGFEKVWILASTTAAALAYDPSAARDEHIAICDLGGGSFDISIVELRRGSFQVLATEWAPLLGGEDFDHLIVRWLIDQIDRLTGVDPSDDSETLALLKESAEDAKCRLSTLGQVKLELPIRGVGLWTTTLTRDALEEMISPQLEWLASPCSKCLRGAGLSRKGVDSVLAVGGATRAPIVLKALGEAMGREPTFAVNPDEAACLGAAISAAIYDGELLDRVVLDVTHHSLGIDYPPGSFAPILPRNSKLPAKASRLFMTTESRFALDLLEGEREQSSANHSLGRLVWDLPFRREETPVEVTLTVDITGALEVTAVDGASRTERKVPVSNEPSLKESAMKRYRAEVESYFETYYSRRSSGKSATSLSPYEKMVAAGRGSRETRLALVRDDDEAVRAAVLASPKMTAEDAETMAKRTDTLPSVLSAIGKHREWSRSYDVARALAFNPGTPAETAMKLMDRLSAKDLDALLETKDLPRALRSQARAIKKMRS